MKSSIWIQPNQQPPFKYDYPMEIVLLVASIYLIESLICVYLSQRMILISNN